MGQTWRGRAADAAALGVIGLMACGLFVRLASFPGLHGDEAWIGLYADRLLHQGMFSPHEMNTYTGPLYGFLIEGVFSRTGPGVWGLRLPGAVLNIVAWLLLWRTSRRVGGPAAGLVWAVLAAGSAIVFLKSRLAWEVYALQPLLLAGAVAAACSALGGGGRAASLALFTASLLGVQNHFIFMSVPLALAASAAALYARGGREPWLGFLQLALVNLLPCALLFLVKPLLSEASWPVLKLPALAVFWAAPLGALLLDGLRERWAAALARLFSGPGAQSLGAWAVRAFVALLAGFLWFHWVALIEIQSGSAVLQRLASWRLPLWAEVPLFVWGAALLVTAAHDGLERLKDGGAGLPPAAALLAVLPVVYAAVFVVFRNTSSVRYYVVISHLIVLAVAARWSWPSTRPGRNDAAALLVGAALAHALSWGAVLGPGSRAPLMFRVGWHKEKSHDFVDKSGLFESVARAGACEVEYNENQLDVLLHFDRLVYPRRCVPGRRVRASYCWSCPPPVISAEFTEAR